MMGNLLQLKLIYKIQADLQSLIDRCYTRDQIVIHFSQYLLGQLACGAIEDYDFFPNVTLTGIDVTVHLYFSWDNMARHELLIVKDDTLNAAYTRSMGVV